MPFKNPEKQKKAVKEAVRRYRQRKKGITPGITSKVTQEVTLEEPRVLHQGITSGITSQKNLASLSHMDTATLHNVKLHNLRLNFVIEAYDNFFKNIENTLRKVSGESNSIDSTKKGRKVKNFWEWFEVTSWKNSKKYVFRPLNIGREIPISELKEKLGEDIRSISMSEHSSREESKPTSCPTKTPPKFQQGGGSTWRNMEFSFTAQKVAVQIPPIFAENIDRALEIFEGDREIAREFLEGVFELKIVQESLVYKPELAFISPFTRKLAKIFKNSKHINKVKREAKGEEEILLWVDESKPIRAPELEYAGDLFKKENLDKLKIIEQNYTFFESKDIEGILKEMAASQAFFQHNYTSHIGSIQALGSSTLKLDERLERLEGVLNKLTEAVLEFKKEEAGIFQKLFSWIKKNVLGRK